MNKHEILIIDDEPQIRKLLQINLESNDYKANQAASGKEGLLLAANHPPELILLDIGLPDKSGHEILKELRTWYTKSIIILSVIDQEEDIVKALDNGATDYLTKPFSVKELQLVVSNQIQQNDEFRKKYRNHLITKSEDVPLTSVDQKFIEKLIKHINDNIEDPNLNVDHLADQMCLSTSQLNRKLQAIINQAPGQLIRNIRLQKAAELIKQNVGNLAEICFQTGFNDQTYFSKAFKQQFGCSPSSYKKEQSNFSKS